MYANYHNRSRRNARGAGWHKRGYRDNGCMWINVRRGSYYGHIRGQDVNDSSTISEFWNDVVRGVMMEDGFPIPADWSVGLYSNKRLIELSEARIDTIFDGGENVIVKFYDENDDERVYDFGTSTWEYHVPGKRY